MDNITPRVIDLKEEIILQIVSDVHLELKINKPVITATGNVLALCGDIGDPTTKSYLSFLKDASSKFKVVLLIAGNHEYYNMKPVAEITKTIQVVCGKFRNVIFLHNTIITINTIRFFGGTLWTDTRNADVSSMSDYSCITYDLYENKKRLMVTSKITSSWHDEATRELKAALSDPTPLVVLTHHLPSFQALESTHTNSAAYATNLESLITSPIILWVHGHYHKSLNYTINDIPIHCNPMGYSKETTGYDGAKIININSLFSSS